MKDIGRRPAFTKLANSEVSLADAAKYLGVAKKTLAVYHCAALDTPIKAANLLSRYDVHEDETVSSNAKGPGLLDGDFLLEGTSLGIAENNADVVATIALFLEEVRDSQSSLPVNRWVLCVSLCLWGRNRLAKMCMPHLLIFAHPRGL